MKPVIKSRLKKWGLGAGCTLGVGLMLNQLQTHDTFAQAHSMAVSGADEQSAEIPAPAQDPVQQEYQQFRQRMQGSEGQQDRRMGRQPQGRFGGGEQGGSSGSDTRSDGGTVAPSQPQATTPQTNSPSKPSTRTRQS